MHQLVVAVVFSVLVMGPCVAALTARSHEGEEEAQPLRRSAGLRLAE